MNTLTASQRFLLVCFATSAVTLAITFFLQGDVRTFAYSVTGLAFAGYIVVTSGDRAKSKRE